MAESEEELKSLLIRVKAAAAAAAKSFQLSLTLCDPIDSSPPGSPSLGFSRQEYWSGLPFPSPMHESENESEVTQSCPTPSNPMDSSRQEYRSGLPLPSPKGERGE